MSLAMFCPKKLAQRSFLVCLYLCPKNTKKNCIEYKKHFNAIRAEKVEPLYVEKYGAPEYIEPLVPKKREVRDVQKSPKSGNKKVQRNTGKRLRRI